MVGTLLSTSFAQGVELQTIRDLLGHSSIGVTSAIHVDVLREGSVMRSIVSGTCSDRTTRPAPRHECGQSRFLRGPALALCLLPEMDSNHQPCDLRSNLLARSGHCLPLPASCAVSECKHPPVLANCHCFVVQPGGKVGYRS
jgi:hypothetical protein